MTTTHTLIAELLKRGNWYTTSEIQGYLQIAGQRLMSESAVSARVRELRKAYKVPSRPRVGSTAWEYRIDQEQEKAA